MPRDSGTSGLAEVAIGGRAAGVLAAGRWRGIRAYREDGVPRRWIPKPVASGPPISVRQCPYFVQREEPSLGVAPGRFRAFSDP